MRIDQLNKLLKTVELSSDFKLHSFFIVLHCLILEAERDLMEYLVPILLTLLR